MAIIRDDARVRFDIPHEQGEWIEVRPTRNSDLLHIDFDTDPFAGMMELLDAVVKGWSYDAPVTPENIRMLDSVTTNWLGDQLKQASGIRTEEEKNGSRPSS